MAVATCLESVSILLAMKLLIRRQPAACHSMFSAALVGLVLVLVAQGILGPVTATSRVSDELPAVTRSGGDAAPSGVSDAAGAPRPAGSAAVDGHAAYGTLRFARRSCTDAAAPYAPSPALGFASVAPIDAFFVPGPVRCRK